MLTRDTVIQKIINKVNEEVGCEYNTMLKGWHLSSGVDTETTVTEKYSLDIISEDIKVFKFDFSSYDVIDLLTEMNGITDFIISSILYYLGP